MCIDTNNSVLLIQYLLREPANAMVTCTTKCESLIACVAEGIECHWPLGPLIHHLLAHICIKTKYIHCQIFRARWSKGQQHQRFFYRLRENYSLHVILPGYSLCHTEKFILSKLLFSIPLNYSLLVDNIHCIENPVDDHCCHNAMDAISFPACLCH